MQPRLLRACSYPLGTHHYAMKVAYCKHLLLSAHEFNSSPCSWQTGNARRWPMFWMQIPSSVGAELGRQIHNLPCCSVGITLMHVLHGLPEFPSRIYAAVSTVVTPLVSSLYFLISPPMLVPYSTTSDSRDHF